MEGKNKQWGPENPGCILDFVSTILCVKFLLCCICIVNSGQDVDMAFICVFVWGPEMS